MDFIERWIGVSPDNGSGWLELVYILVLLTVLASSWILLRRRRAPRTRRRRPAR